MKTLLFASVLVLFTTSTDAWNNTPNPFTKFLFLSNPRSIQRTLLQFDDKNSNNNNDEDRAPTTDKNQKNNNNNNDQYSNNVHETRRRFLNAAAMNVCFLGATVHPAVADTSVEATKYISGKPPQVPGAKPIDKSNVKGTKKDPDFLRSIGTLCIVFWSLVCYYNIID
jgi:hypothetical protein